MKFVFLIMLKPSILSSKLARNEVISLNFEEVIAKKIQISVVSKILNNVQNINIF